MVYGYVRVSAKDQNEDRQIIAMREVGVSEKNIYMDKQSGKDFKRKQYKRLVRKMKKDDLFFIHVLDRTLAYKVNQISVVRPEDTRKLQIVDGKDYVTLVTCTPYGVNTERLLVRGHRVPYVEQEVADEKTPLSGISLHTNYLLWVIIGLVITTIFILVLYLKEKKLQKKKNETS